MTASVLAIQVKMTGQLFVLPAGTRHDRHVHLRLTLGPGSRGGWRPCRGAALAALPRRPQVRPGRPLPAWPGRRPSWAPTTRASSSRSTGPSRSTRPSRCAASASACGRGGAASSRSSWTSRSWPAWATSTPTRPSGGRGCTRCARWRRCGRTTSAGSTRPSASVLGEAVARRGSSVDDYTAPEGDGAHAGAPRRLPAHRPALPPLRPAHPAPRAGPARHALLLLVPAPAGTPTGAGTTARWRPAPGRWGGGAATGRSSADPTRPS